MKHYGLTLPEGSEIVNLTVPSGTSFPGSANTGEMFLRTDENKVYIYNNGGWDPVSTETNNPASGSTWTISGSNISYTTGNVGIGVSALESWSAPWTALQIGGNTSIIGLTAAGASSSYYVLQNALWNGVNWLYQDTDEASYMYSGNGTFVFKVAASGTAETPISWIDTLTINNDGSAKLGAVAGQILTLDNTTANNVSISSDRNLNLSSSAGYNLTLSTTTTGNIFLNPGNFTMVGGAVSPDGTLHVHTASAGAVTANSTADDLVVENNMDGGISIFTPDANYGSLYFGSPSDSIGSYLNWNKSTGRFRISTHTAGGYLSFGSASDVDAMIINSSGNVGIGTTSPDGKLHVYVGSAGAISAPADADDFVIENSTTGGMSILVPDASNANLFFGSASDSLGAFAQWNYSTLLFKLSSSSAGASLVLGSGNNTEAMRINSSGNVGIGNTSPDSRLEVTSSSFDTQVKIGTTANATAVDDIHASILFEGRINSGTLFDAAKISSVQASSSGTRRASLVFQTAGPTPNVLSEKMRIDDNGIVGLGVSSLEAWHSNYTALQIGGNSSVAAVTAAGAGGNLMLFQNAYFDGTSAYKYQDTDEATQYIQTSGTHQLRVAPSGTADTAIGWTTALQINNSGNIGIKNVSLEAWHSNYTALQIGGTASAIATTTPASGQPFLISNNAYYDGAWKYLLTDAVSQYYQQSGYHRFRVASSGTTDTSISSWTESLFLDNNGNAGFSNTSLETWNTAYTAVQMGGNTTLLSLTSPGPSSSTYYLQNTYHDGSNWKYQDTDQASYYKQGNGEHVFGVAVSGTADANITWSYPLVLNNDANVGMGVTSLEAWQSAYSALQLGGNSALFANTSKAVDNGLRITQNAFLDSADWKYFLTDEASMYLQRLGEHTFRVAAAGSTITAGSFVTSTEYRIETIGTTDFTAIGAASNTVGVIFTATGAGSGTGTASETVITWTDALAIANTGAITTSGNLTSGGVLLTDNLRIGSTSDYITMNIDTGSNYLNIFSPDGTGAWTTRFYGSTGNPDDMTVEILDGNLKITAGNAKIAGTTIVGSTSVTPDGTLHVHTASAGAVTANPGADDLVIENSTNGGLSILVPDANNANIALGTATDSIGALIQWNYTSSEMYLGTDKAGAYMRFLTGNGTEAMRIDSSQNVGIGIANPDGTLHVHTASAGTVTADIAADDLVIENSGDGGLTILTPNANTSRIYLGSPSDSSGGVITYNQSSTTMAIGPAISGGTLLLRSGNGTTAVTVDSSQNVAIAGDTLNIATTKTPSSASDTGTTGDIVWDSGYVYVCVATNTWKRAALSTW